MSCRKVIVGNLHSEGTPPAEFREAIHRYQVTRRHQLKNTIKRDSNYHTISDTEHEALKFCKGVLIAAIILGSFAGLAYLLLIHTS